MTNFSEVSGKYFYYYFSQFFYNRVMKMTAKTSVDSVRYEMIDKMDIIFPSIEEQQLIVNFLLNIDVFLVEVVFIKEWTSGEGIQRRGILDVKCKDWQ